MKKNIFLLLLVSFVSFAYGSPIPSFNLEFIESSNKKVYADNNLTGTLIGNTVFQSGYIDNVDFSGMCDYITLPSRSSGVKFDFPKNNNIISQNGFSVSFWANISKNQYLYAVFLQALDVNNNKVFEINSYTSDGDKKKGLSFVDNASSYNDSNSVFQYDKWHYIAITYNANNKSLVIYENGKPYKNITISSNAALNKIKTLYIGTTKSSSYGLIGSIDEIKIYNKPLSLKDVYAIYNNEKNYKNYDGSTRTCVNEVCTLVSTIESDPLSDIFGKSVFTKKKNIFNCQHIKEKRGSCISEDKSTNIKIPEIKKKIAYIDTLEGGDLGDIAAIASAETMAQSLFSGWKGYCVQGLDEDFSWVSDPYFWGSVALSYASGSLGSGSSAGSAAGKTAGSAAGSAAGNAASNAAGNAAAKEAAKQTIKEAAKKEMFKKMASYAICVAQAGIDIGEMSQHKDVPCDPVDEICDVKSSSYDDQYYTLSEQQYNDMLAENPSFADYIKVTKKADGQVTFMIVYKSFDSSLDTSELEAAKKKAEQKMKQIQYAITGITTAVCLGRTALSGSSYTTAKKGGGDAGVSPADAATAVASVAANAICGPACGAAVQVVGALATSFKKINSCGNKDDATQKGSRHIDTYNANQMGLCREIQTKCKIKSKLGSGCQLHEKYFCCYDSVQTMLLAEQIKAELGLSWAHCTGISLNEFIHINFQKCTNTSGIDGTTLPYDTTYSERKKAFQFKYKCLDYTKYISYIMKITGGRYNKNSIQELITDGIETK